MTEGDDGQARRLAALRRMPLRRRRRFNANGAPKGLRVYAAAH